MNLFDKITQWLGLENNFNNSKEMEMLQMALGKSNRLKYRGEYAAALQELESARKLAAQLPNQDYVSVVDFHQADVYIKQGRGQEAQALLQSIQQQASSPHQAAQRAYVMTSLGQLEQAQGHWDAARQHYEQALELARASKEEGAEARAQGYLADTYLEEDNLNFAVYLLEKAFPKVNARGEIEHSSYFAGRLGEALIRLNRKNEGLAYLGRALRLAEKMEYRDFEIRWRGELAVHAMAESHYAEARSHYMRVLAQASLRGAEADYLLALCRVSKSCLRLGEYDAGLDYARQAVENTQAQPDDAAPRIMAQAAYGVALRTIGSYNEAITPLEAVIPYYEGFSTSPADYSYVDVLRNLAASQAEVLNYETATLTYHQALTYAEATQSTMDIAGTHRDLGILHARRGAYDEAIEAWSAALRYYEAENQHARSARLYCDIANIRKQQGQGKRARKDYEQALMLLNAITDLETRGIVMANAATAYVDQGDVESAEFFFVESIKIAQKLNDRQAEATRRGNYGWFLLATGRAKRALATLEYALRQSENLGLHLQAAVQMDNLGLAHDELKAYDQAAEQHRKALESVQAVNNPHWQAIIGANLGHSLVSLGELDEAEALFDAAYAVGKTTHHAEVLVRTLNGKARLALKRGELAKAGESSEYAVNYARQADTRRLLADTLITRSSYHAASGNNPQAQADWSEARELLESLRIPAEDHSPLWLKNTETEN